MNPTEPLRRLEAAGFSRDQAEAIVDAQTGELVTNADLKAGLAELKADMLKVAIGIVIANAALTFAIVRVLDSA